MKNRLNYSARNMLNHGFTDLPGRIIGEDFDWFHIQFSGIYYAGASNSFEFGTIVENTEQPGAPVVCVVTR